MSSNSIETEYNEIEAKNGWMSIFQEIREKSEQEARQNDFSMNESKKINNRRFNRYRDVSPYDHSRIVLQRGEIDYINANLVKNEKADRKYILCQGPLPFTVSHFWLMVWEHNSKAILMLNKLIEKKQIKCHMYWPDRMGEEHKMEMPDVQLAIEYLQCEEYKNFSKRIFRLTDIESNKSREIIQFHYTTWPDFGVPSSPVAFLQFLKQVRDSGALDKDVGPPIIHCSAGIGRSGTFCLVDCCLVLIDKEGENKISVQEVLLQLRRYRMGLIQTVDQLYFSYQAIIEGMKRMNNSSLDEYEELLSSPTSQSEAEIEDAPPPLPPPRFDSLQHARLISKPLPVIPTSESMHEDFMNSEREQMNNLMNLEKSKQYEIRDSNINRPLPPLPKENSLDKVNEDSDSNEDDLIEENDSDLNGNSDDATSIEFDESLNTTSSTNVDSSFDANSHLPPLPNGLEVKTDVGASSPECETSPNTELRRRKRIERQTAMEDKIREIKRKQKEVENKTSPKKRRSILISLAAGVCIGVLCVYFYTKNF